MKIAYLLGSLNRGGAETLILDIARNASRYGLNIICIHRKKGLLFDSFKNSGIDMYELRPVNRLDVSYILSLRQALKSHIIQIVHAHQVIDALVAILATIKLNIEIVLTLHGHLVTKNKLSHYFYKIAFQKVDKLIFVSQSQLEDYLNKFHKLKKSKCYVIHNGLDFSKLYISNENAFRKELDIPENYMLLGSVSNFTSGRDPLTICRFLVLLKKEEINFRFLFIGARIEKEAYIYDNCLSFCKENGINKDVLFIGSRDDIPKILHQLDAFIFSTVSDTFGIAIIEAIAAGLTVFVNDTEVIKEICENGRFATLYKTRNENDLLEKFIHFLGHKDIYRNKALLAAKQVQEKYSIQNHISELLHLYNQANVNKLQS